MNIGIPSCCPLCGKKLEILESKDGIKNLFCVNEKCSSRFSECITSFVSQIGVMGVAGAMLTEWKVNTIKDILNFKPNPSYKNEVKFVKELDKKLWCISKKNIFLAMSAFVYGIGQKEMEKFYNKHGDKVFDASYVVKASSYVKEQEIIKSLPMVREYCELIFNDPRYNEPKVVEQVKVESTKGSICFTGKLETMTRKDAQAKAKKLGYSIADSVSKELGTLVVADAGLQGAPSSKLKKAMSLGIKIMSESEFANL